VQTTSQGPSAQTDAQATLDTVTLIGRQEIAAAVHVLTLPLKLWVLDLKLEPALIEMEVPRLTIHTGWYLIRVMESHPADLTRQRILDAAFAEIYRHGYQAASVASILVDTGLTKGALYHHFLDKKSLGLAVVDEMIAQRLLERYLLPLREADQPAARLLDLMAAKSAQSDEDIQLGCPLNNLMQEMSPLDEDFRTRLNRILVAWQEVIATALQRAQAAGEVRPEVDCHAAALFIVSAWEGCAGTAKNMQSAEAFRACMAQLHLYVLGLMRERPS
jgi:TetR/AcrR family transcriptional regulator, transcriptional repressor for nem operon